MAVALAVPAIRTVIVEGWAEAKPDGSIESGHRIIPVLGVRSSVVHNFHQPSDRPYRGIAATPEAMAALGWTLEGTDIEDDLIIWSEEYGAVVPVKAALGEPWEGGAYRVEHAPWPPEDDPDRLAEAIRQVEAKARASVEAEARGGRPR